MSDEEDDLSDEEDDDWAAMEGKKIEYVGKEDEEGIIGKKNGSGEGPTLDSVMMAHVDGFDPTLDSVMMARVDGSEFL